jgi:hypothetical protein
MARYLPLFFLLLLTGTLAHSQTALAGKVTDGETGEPIIFGSVALYRNGVLTTGTETDIDGNFSFSNIDPGTYDVEASYVGYQPQRVTGVRVLAGRANKLDVQLASGGGVVLDQVEVIEYRVPLIEQDNTTSGGTLTSDQIKNLPTRNIGALAATTAGLSQSDEGDAITVRGSRSNATDYYVDGMRVQGSLVPESEIDQLQVITGGMEAQYGDVTGGIISITTKGPSSKFSGGVEVETSRFLDPYENSLVGFNLSGPILKSKSTGESILGFRIAGRLTDQTDDDPPAVNVFRIRDSKLAELEANPIINIGGNPFVAADFLQAGDVEALDANPFERFRRNDINAKLDARLSNAIDVSLTGVYVNSENQFTPGGWRVLNSHNNPFSFNSTYRGNFRFRHRLGGVSSPGGDRTAKAAVIQNASYTLQFGYENTQNTQEDPRHEDRYFDYGYVGNFDIEWVPTFTTGFDFDSLQFFLTHNDYRQVLRSYSPGDVNPILANYNNALGLTPGEGINSRIGDFIITDQGEGAGNLLSLATFNAPNGRISSVYDNSWGFHTNVGWVYNLSRKTNNDIYTFNARASFDLVPGGSEKGRHSIQLGIWYEQRTNRLYDVRPRNLWEVARQQVNDHIKGIAENADTIGYIDIPGFPNTPLREVSIVEGSDNQFYRKVRESLGIPLNQYVNIDGLRPDQLSLDMFSAKELNDQQLIDYYGYDYLGNNFDGTFEDFFRATNENGVRTFPVAPNRPIYTAAYIQDKFTFKDIIFRLGVRVDRYDANTKVMKDPYSLYEIMGAGEYHGGTGDPRPGNIGDDFKVYLNDAGTSVQGYRDGDDWYFANGNPANNPGLIFPGGLVFPKYQDPRVEQVANYIKSRDFDVNTAFKDYEVQVNIMPRLAFSFPISTEANFFAHYDILVMRPPSNTLATARDFFYFTDISYGAGNPLSNPSLRPERTIDYEVGFQQKLSNTTALKIAAYYKEMRDMIQQRTFFPVPLVNQYTTYDNIDFGTVKGFTFQFDMRRTGNVTIQANYTLQFADGTGSDANSQRGLTSRGNLRTLFPLNFDERHRIVANVDYRYSSGKRYNGPRLFGADIFANAGVNLQAITVSGRPYTARITPTELGGEGVVGSINGARKPWNFTLNLRVDKTFDIGKGLGLNVYARVSNLLDRRNVINLYSVTGSPDDSGFLQSSRGFDQIQTIQNSLRDADSYLASYQWVLINPDFYSLPRRIFIGAIFDF